MLKIKPHQIINNLIKVYLYLIRGLALPIAARPEEVFGHFHADEAHIGVVKHGRDDVGATARHWVGNL